MVVARHCRRRRLILSVSTLGFFISSFSAVLALDFTGPVVSVLDGTSMASTVQRKVNLTASERSRVSQSWYLGRKSRSRHSARTSITELLLM